MDFPDHLIAHRGASSVAPENTLVAFEKADALGADWVEFDVMLTKDNVAIVMHDYTLDRTTNGDGNVADTDYAEIADLDAGSWFSEEFKDTRVPTFSAALQYLKSLMLGINVEIKSTPGTNVQTVEVAVKVLHKHWPSNLPLLISSASSACLFTVKQHAPDYQLGIIVDKWPDNWLSELKKHPIISVHANHKILSKKRVAKLSKLGYLVLAYTVNDKDRARELIKWGVSAVFSDKADLL